MLIIDQLSVSLNNQSILRDISFTQKSGEIIGVVGKNGAGKTTLFNAIYDRINFLGEIRVNGNKNAKKNIAYIETENYFYPFLTVGEFLNFINHKHQSLYKEMLVEYFNLPQNVFIENMSSGEKKKLNIISNLLLKKELYIFDEPFNSLDMESTELLKLLIKSKLFQNKYILISSHTLDSLISICDKIIYLNNGTIEKEFVKEEFHKIEELYRIELFQKIKDLETFHRSVD